MTVGSRVAISVALSLVCSFARRRDAHAEDVLVIESPDTHAVAARVMLELRALGLTVRTEPPRDLALDLDAIETRTRDAHAVATLALRTNAGRVEVWVWERVTRKLVLRDVVTRAQDPAESALRVVEVLRASLLEARDPPAHTIVATLPASVAPLVAPARPLRARWHGALSVGGTAFVSAGGVPATAHARASGSVVYADRVRLSLTLDAPLMGATLTGPEGEAVVRWGSASAFVGLHTLPWTSRWDIRPALGLGLAWVGSNGTPAPGYVGARTSEFTGLAWAQIEWVWSPAQHVEVWIDTRVAASLSLQRFGFAGREVATWGLPLLGAGVGLSIRWP